VVFRSILQELTASVDGAVGAVFMDQQGEAVELFSTEIPPYELKVLGAYHGIFLRNASALMQRAEGGVPDRIKFRWRGMTTLDAPLPDGYFVVLLLRPGVCESLAWQQLARYTERIIREMA
jgi:hypothetical protein